MILHHKNLLEILPCECASAALFGVTGAALNESICHMMGCEALHELIVLGQLNR